MHDKMYLIFFLKQTTDNIYSSLINSYEITLGKFDAVVLIDDNTTHSLAAKLRVNLLFIIAVTNACMFAFN